VSGFAPEWLRLREGADHRARNAALFEKLAARFAARDAITIVDLGAGLGSNLRAIAPRLSARQHWILVDHDPVLLASAGDAIRSWADSARVTTAGIEAVKSGHALRVELKRHDLAADPVAWNSVRPDLVTAAALFDLVSETWIKRFVTALTRSQLPLYAALTHDGTTEWLPAHPADAAMQAAFVQHFARDKGFGPSVGARASSLLTEHLAAAGYEIERAPSPWRLGRNDKALIAALAQGWVQAVEETGKVPSAALTDWFEAHTADSISCSVGHEDLVAFPR
jgi:hypothetical protein